MRYDWRFWAREKQLPPVGNWSVWLILTGRGFGKTWTGSNWIIERAYKYPQYGIGIWGQTADDVRNTMIETEPGSIMKQSPPWFVPAYKQQAKRLEWPNGAVARLFYGDAYDQARGPEIMTAWVDELAKFQYPDKSWDNLEMTLRAGPNPQALVTTTPRPIPIIKQLLKDKSCIMVTGSTFENEANLSRKFLDRIKARYEGTRVGRQELHGEVLDDVLGALWDRKILDETRFPSAPELSRIVVGVDPAITNTETSDETGIIVCGQGKELEYGKAHFYVLDDLSLKGSPEQWARRVCYAYEKYNADMIVAETNQGGDMVVSTLQQVNPNLPVRKRPVYQRKELRAEPVSMLSEQKRLHIVGFFKDLEDQMCEWVPGDDSPDRLDAMVLAMKELIQGSEYRIYYPGMNG